MLQDAWHSPDLALKGTHFKSVANTHKYKTGLGTPLLPIQCILWKWQAVWKFTYAAWFKNIII